MGVMIGLVVLPAYLQKRVIQLAGIFSTHRSIFRKYVLEIVVLGYKF